MSVNKITYLIIIYEAYMINHANMINHRIKCIDTNLNRVLLIVHTHVSDPFECN